MEIYSLHAFFLAAAHYIELINYVNPLCDLINKIPLAAQFILSTCLRSLKLK